MLVKRFIDIPPYLKWDRGAAFHKCNGYDCTVIVGRPEYAAPSGEDIQKR
jgi:hypothetical protein